MTVGLVRKLFFEAVEKAPDERGAFLESVCAGDAELRRRVERMLQAYDQPDRLLDRPIAGVLPMAEHCGTGEAASLSFLQPSDKSGSLGRLGHYEVLEEVGRGGMGIVLRAFDEKLHRVVAIKALLPAYASSGSARQRFVREARAAAAVTHDNVIAIHAVEDDGAVPYLVMQFISGDTLQEKLDREGALPLPEVLRIGLQIAEGLAAAHRQGLIHRDIKPANILLENGIERVKITDFGLARAVDDASLTQSGLIVGTPAFMAPEQAEGRAVDHRCDLFSLGSVMYAMCAGHPPFRADSTVAILRRVCDETPRSLRAINPEIPEWLDELIGRLHAKEPSRRFESAEVVASLLGRRLAQWQSGVAFHDNDLRIEPSAGSSAAATRSAPRKREWPFIALLVVVIAAVAFGWNLGTARQRSEPQTVGVTTTEPQTAVPNESADDGSTDSERTVETEQRPAQPVQWKPRAPVTAEELARLKSPFDERRREQIPEKLLAFVGGGDATKAPPELVAVFGVEIPSSDLAFSSDGRHLALGGYDSRVNLWDLSDWPSDSTEPSLRVLRGHAGQVWSVQFSPDGSRVASGSFDGTIIVWDVTTGQNMSDLLGHSRSNSLIAFRPDGQVIAAGNEEGLVNRWSVATGQRLEPLRLQTGKIRAVAYRPDGKLLAAACEDNTVKVVEAETGRRRRVFECDTKQTHVAFSPDGQRVAATNDVSNQTSFRVWNVETGEEQSQFVGHTSHSGSLAFHPLGQLLATGSWDGTARLWSPPSLESRVWSLGSADAAGLVSVAWSPDGRYLAAVRENLCVCVFRIGE